MKLTNTNGDLTTRHRGNQLMDRHNLSRNCNPTQNPKHNNIKHRIKNTKLKIWVQRLRIMTLFDQSGLMDMSKDPNADTKLSYKKIDQKPTSRNKLQQV